MAITFPSSPSAGDIFTSNGKSWQYVNGKWESYGETVAPDVFSVDAANDVVNVYGSLSAGASASIGTDLEVSGDLTVDTNTLHVNSANNRVGIGTTSPDTNLEVIGGFTVNTSGAFDTHTIHVDTANDWVGIGTNTPIAKLDVSGGANIEGTAIIRNFIIANDFYGPAEIMGDLRVDTNTLAVDSTNNRVGIGTTSPAYTLDVAGDIHISGSSPYLILTDTDTNADSRISAQSGQGSLRIEADYNNEAADTNILFYSDGAEKARIDSSGNLGINTTSPSYTLDVDGDIRMTGSFYWQTPSDTGTQDPVLWIDGGNANVPLIRIGTGSYSLDADHGFTIQYEGTGSGTLNNLVIYSDNEQGSQIKALTITQDAKFGFGGVTDPQAKLHVSGSDVPLLYLRQSVNGTGARIQFTDQSSEAQKGYMTYVHSDGASYNRSNAFIFDSTEASMAVVSTDDFVCVGTLQENYSDERLKTIHGTIPNALEKLKGIRGYIYTQNEIADSLGFNEVGVKQVGVSAQEVMTVMPEVVTTAPISYTDKTEEEYYTVRYNRMVPLLIETIHELIARIEALEAN